jgi:plastocyanin
VNRYAVTAVATVVAALSVTVVACGDDQPESSSVVVTDVADAGEFDHEFVIPNGTSDLLAAGEVVEIVPRELVVEVGDSIRIVNNDVRGHAIGVFYVGAGETLTQRFDSPGVLEGLCDVHPSGSFTLRVEA